MAARLFRCAAEDTPEAGARLLKKVLGYRVFADENGKMNKNVQQVEGVCCGLAIYISCRYTKRLAAEF